LKGTRSWEKRKEVGAAGIVEQKTEGQVKIRGVCHTVETRKKRGKNDKGPGRKYKRR